MEADLFIFNFIPDHQAEAFSPEVGEPITRTDALVRSAFDGLVKWDSIYFLHVSTHGYTSESTFAFFPLFPFTVRFLSYVLVQCFPVLSFYTCCMVSAVILNLLLFTAIIVVACAISLLQQDADKHVVKPRVCSNHINTPREIPLMCFILLLSFLQLCERTSIYGAALSLYDLSLNLFKSKKFAYVTAALFTFNPAAIFFSSCYTESMFSFFVFKALSLITSENNDKLSVQLRSTLWFMLASSTRSNGFVNCGFIAYYHLQSIARKWIEFKISSAILFRYFLQCLSLCILVITPILLVNAYGYFRFCSCHFGTSSLNGASCFSRPGWCNNTFPFIYSHIQTHNWGLGLFAYYQFKKIPNFLLASPLIALSFYSSYLHFNQHKGDIFHLGLLSSTSRRNNHYEFASRNLFPFYFHLMFLVFFALLYMHVEVSTRMVFSSSPVLYWTVGSFILSDLRTADAKALSFSNFSSLSFKSKICIFYFLCYYVIGVALHCNFLPWT